MTRSWTRVFDDEVPGQTTYYHQHADGRFTLETVQHDISPILENNKANASKFGKATHGKDLFPVASIPCVVQVEWMKRYGIRDICSKEYEPLIRRLLNSNEYRYLRTSEIIL